ncbi:MAG: hypothetical protein QMD09_07740 [Desulfatibacillaceae bacterium]|nr:hypothetical protein [Desulfatibacillaceae bacterium]
MDLEIRQFKDIDLDDPFFDSLKQDYKEFVEWFDRKAGESAYVYYNKSNKIEGILYLKDENESLNDVNPPLRKEKRIKIGTFKINPHGTLLGERFVKKVFDHAISKGVYEIYATVFKKHEALIALLKRYGFRDYGFKTTHNGTELVLLKKLSAISNDIVSSYPLIRLSNQNIYLLSLYPKWHTRLLPDSILKTEQSDIIEDISHSNSIHKVYLAAMKGMENLKRGDIIVIYRTSDEEGHAHYRSVVTSICVLEEYKNIREFEDKADFLRYCQPYSIFTERELIDLWKFKRYKHIIRFMYNIALKKRPTRQVLLDEIGLDQNAYFGFLKLTRAQLKQIVEKGKINESLIVD